jgi:hypothetical protein
MTLATLLAAAEAIHAAARKGQPWLGGRLMGIGWATVELERAAAELTADLGEDLEAAWAPAQPDEALGARAWVSAERAGGATIVLLEPSTEGPLAASLARFGEGVAAVYVSADTAIDDGAAGDSALSPTSNGPLGPQRRLLGRPAWGPHLLVVGGA